MEANKQQKIEIINLGEGQQIRVEQNPQNVNIDNLPKVKS